MNPSTPLTALKGVGPKTAEQLQAAGLACVRDLLYFLPRSYEDYSQLITIAALQPGKVTLKVTVEAVITRRVRRGMHITEATLIDSTGKVAATWFNQPYRAAQLVPAKSFFVSGEFGLSGQRYQLVNPSLELASGKGLQTGRILPVYRHVKALKSHTLRKVFENLKPHITMLNETLPADIVHRADLLSHADALSELHFPSSQPRLDRARERYAFEELFSLLLASALNKQQNSKLKSSHIHFDESSIKQFVSSLPFTLTDAQRRASWQIVQDFNKPHPMNRLLQGDVGSGKTVVAAIAAFVAAHSGYQTALLAPTELLAVQHAESLARLLEPHGVSVGLLIGATKKAAKAQLKAAIASGSIAVTVGTHALLTDDTTFTKLGFVVIDEQHRFGVAQRQRLLKKAANMPHLLAMTATPIPRSLALTVYGELDVAVLDELPAGRKPITTKVWSPNSRTQLYHAIDKQLDVGRQVYVVCPTIYNDDSSERASVEAEYKRLSSGVFKHRRVGLLHGKLSSEQKDTLMREFAAGKLDVLVSTTVIEVGVDVPNAVVMLIEGAENFGLSQLHQLRGRVGRSTYQSYCYLVPSGSQIPNRLRELEKSNDGFYLAEVDLAARGPGEIYGQAQHGQLNLAIANLADTKLTARVQAAARAFVAGGTDLLQYPRLQAQVAHYQRLTTLN